MCSANSRGKGNKNQSMQVNFTDPFFFLCLLREERESWIRAKYEQKLFVAPLPPPTPGKSPDITLSGRLLLAVMERNLPKLLLLLAHCTKEDMNAPPGLSLPTRTLLALRLPGSALHAACQQADAVMTQLLVWVGFTLTPLLYSHLLTFFFPLKRVFFTYVILFPGIMLQLVYL